jgi:ComF family protein
VSTVYAEAANDLVWKLKFAHARAAVRPMVALMSNRMVFDGSTVFVPVPTATSRVRQRGYDQAELLCRQLSAKVGVPYRFVLTRHGQSRQVGTGKTERVKHLSSAFKVRNPAIVAGKHVVLIDDVLTTGATLEAAARVVKKAGAKHVDAMVFAQA